MSITFRNQGDTNDNNFSRFQGDDYQTEVSGRSARLQSALFPDDNVYLAELFENPQTKTPISSMIRLFKATQKFKFVTTNFTDYLEDTDAAIEASTDLIKMLGSNDEEDELKSLRFSHNLCKKQASRLGLASKPEMVGGLRLFLSPKTDQEKLGHSLSCLQHISKGEQGAKNIVAGDCIPLVLQQLDSSHKKNVECAVSILDNAMLLVPRSRDLVRSLGGVQALVRLLELHTDVRLLTVVLDCLHKLAYQHPEAKLAILAARGTERLVAMLRQFTYEKLLFTASKLMKVLSVCNANKPVLVEVGALEILTTLLGSASSRLVQSCLWSVRNLSDHASHLSAMQTLIRRLIELLGSEDINESICAVGCLCNLTVGNADNKVAFVEYGGVQAMCQLMCEKISREEVVEPGAAALRHVTHGQPLEADAVNAVLDSPLLSNLAVLIRGRPDKMLPLIKALVGLLRNLALLSPHCRRSLIDLGVTDSLCDIFGRTMAGMHELSRQRNSIVSVSSELSYVEGVRLEDLMELSLCALQALARDPMAQKIISYQSRMLQNVVQIVMMREYSPPLHRACLGLLAEVVEFGDSARLLEAEGFNSQLSELLNSPNKAIAIYAAVVMFFINKDKPQEYRDRIQQELVASLKKQFNEEQERQQEELPRDNFYNNNNNQYASSERSLLSNQNRHESPLASVEGRSLPDVPTAEPRRFYDNQAFQEDFDQSDAKVSYSTPNRQRQPFRDVEL